MAANRRTKLSPCNGAGAALETESGVGSVSGETICIPFGNHRSDITDVKFKDRNQRLAIVYMNRDDRLPAWFVPDHG
jgi:hypothetical protein